MKVAKDEKTPFVFEKTKWHIKVMPASKMTIYVITPKGKKITIRYRP